MVSVLSGEDHVLVSASRCAWPAAIFVKTTNEERGEIKKLRDERHESCLVSEDVVKRIMCNSIYLIQPNFIKRPSYVGTLIVFILLPVLFVVSMFGSVRVFVWIKAGFNKNA